MPYTICIVVTTLIYIILHKCLRLYWNRWVSFVFNDSFVVLFFLARIKHHSIKNILCRCMPSFFLPTFGWEWDEKRLIRNQKINADFLIHDYDLMLDMTSCFLTGPTAERKEIACYVIIMLSNVLREVKL